MYACTTPYGRDTRTLSTAVRRPDFLAMSTTSANTILLHTSVGPIALSPDELRSAIELAESWGASHETGNPLQILSSESLLTAAEMAERFSMDATWFLTHARESRIPHVRLGKYVRFDPGEIRAFFQRRPDRHADSEETHLRQYTDSKR